MRTKVGADLTAFNAVWKFEAQGKESLVATIYIWITSYGELKIGTMEDLEVGHLKSFPMENIDCAWYDFFVDPFSPNSLHRIYFHFQQKEPWGDINCNWSTKMLPITDKEFPYQFSYKFRNLVIRKQLKLAEQAYPKLKGE